MQYFTGVSGQILSYNYDPNTGLQLSNQDYSACIRMERNFCGIQYTVCEDIDEGMASKFKYLSSLELFRIIEPDSEITKLSDFVSP